MNENRPHVPIKEKFTKVVFSKRGYVVVPSVIGAVIAADVFLKGGWAIKEGDVNNDLISFGITTAFFSLMAFVNSKSFLEGKETRKRKNKFTID